MSTAAEADPFADVMQHLKYWCRGEPSQVGKRVARLLEAWDGLHHFDAAEMKKINWADPYCIILRIRGVGATFDFSELTRLVFLAHDHCIRVEILPCNPQFVRLLFHPRRTREGFATDRHPTLERAVAAHRESFPEADLLPEARS